MPRFMKTVVPNDDGELILPGAYGMAPGQQIERRSTFEWDNEQRVEDHGALPPAPLIDVDDLSQALSEDSDDDDNDDNKKNRDSDNDKSEESDEKDGDDKSVSDRGDSNERVSACHTDSEADVEQGNCNSSSGGGDAAMEANVVLASEVEKEISDVPWWQFWILLPHSNSNHDQNKLSVKQRRLLKWGGLICGLTILAVVLIVWLKVWNDNSSTKNHASSHSNKDEFAPPSNGLAYRGNLGLQQIIAEIWEPKGSGGNINDTTTSIIARDKLQPNWSSPYFQALYWLLYQDPLQVLLNDDFNKGRIQQRFILAAFYYATNVNSGGNLVEELQQRQSSSSASTSKTTTTTWKHCGKPPSPLPGDMACEHTMITNWEPARRYTTRPAKRWLSGASECDWSGVTCHKDNDDHDRVTAIVLEDYGLSGTLLPELGQALTSLQTLALPFQPQLIGRLPASLWQSTSLMKLELPFNQLEGTMDLGTFDANITNTSLQLLNLTGNALTGKIPEELAFYSNLRHVALAVNDLTGTLPASVISQLSHLEVLQLSHNQLKGSIGGEMFSSVSPLKELDFSNNNLTSTLPSQLGLLHATLERLNVGQNNLQGTLPLDIYELTQLVTMDLHSNQFTGTMASNIGQLQLLEELFWQSNAFSGTLPTEIVLMWNITEFYIQDNKFRGEIPSAFCDTNFIDGVTGRPQPLTLYVNVIADCTPSSTAGVASVECPEGCCSSCCEPLTGECTTEYSAVSGLLP